MLAFLLFLWQPSLRGIITRAIKSLGHQVVGTCEYYTSVRCLRPKCLNFLGTVPSRSKYCRSCKVYLDRDVVGSENLARICEAQLINQRRPTKFIPEAVAEAEGSRRKRRSEAEAGEPKKKRKRQPAAQGTKRKRKLEQEELGPKRLRHPEPEGSKRKPKHRGGKKLQ
ncbi:hypothetical protein BGX34_004704 [Mortierella sp. NVP85]|nr:hypothetical protein BGX34_004704 [Mortierella sp. NVP85]